MRLFAVCALVLSCAACGEPPEPAPASTSAESVDLAVNPARIDRARDALPDGYEVATYTGPAAPISLWGMGSGPVSDPPQCAALAAPAVDPAAARGWSASGQGGIVYAVVAGSAAVPDPALMAQCDRWSVAAGHTTGTVTESQAPEIAAAQTVGMSTAVSTVVEGGTETRSRADTVIAYLGSHVCFVAVVTDPGSSYPPLSSDYAADLLTETVSALRG